jgi:CRISPR-associated endonuclease/helicase Cas3
VKGSWTLKRLRVANDKKGKVGKKAREELEACMAGATLIVDARLGGLQSGLLDDKEMTLAETADDGSAWPERASTPGVSITGFRVTRLQVSASDDEPERPGTSPDKAWVRRLEFVVDAVDGEPTNVLVIDGSAGESATEDDRAEAARPQKLDEHQTWAEQCAWRIAKGVGLQEEWGALLALAARLHDEGKRAPCWQRAFKAPRDGFYAKTSGPIDFTLLDGYRHELGSLPYVEKDDRFQALPADAKDLVLHLIATHHGYGRPVIGTSGCDDAPPSMVEARAREVALRFARLQKRWGPWGLAWWEALLRAADQEASRRNQEHASSAPSEDQV